MYLPACSIEGALSYIVNNLSDMSQLAAQTDRLDALLGAMAAQAERLPGGVQRCVLCNHPQSAADGLHHIHFHGAAAQEAQQ